MFQDGFSVHEVDLKLAASQLFFTPGCDIQLNLRLETEEKDHRNEIQAAVANFDLKLKIHTAFFCKNSIAHFSFIAKHRNYFLLPKICGSFLLICFVFIFISITFAELSEIVLLMKFSSFLNVLRRVASTKFNPKKNCYLLTIHSNKFMVEAI